ncbi:MAG: TIGR00341 family protein [Pirellulales bacterium]
MALRVMQVFLPQGSDSTPDELLEDREILGRWRDTDSGQTVLHLLVPADETEPIMDRFEEHYADVEGFHVVLMPVEAVLPRPKVEPNPAKPEESNGSNGKKHHRISREEMYDEATDSIGITRVFLSMTVLSAVVACVGLMRNDVAVIIGAMVIAPLLGPNMAMSLAATLGDASLLRRAFLVNLMGFGVAFAFAVLVGLVFTADPSTPAIAARTSLGLGDILLALAAGTAGALAFTRGETGAAIGVMVAVALMPPLVACGMLVGSGYNNHAIGAFLLTAANVICINLAGVVTFIVQGVRPRSWREAIIAKKETRRAMLVWAILLAALVLVLKLSPLGSEL